MTIEPFRSINSNHAMPDFDLIVIPVVTDQQISFDSTKLKR
jgi:hypothetical protein